MGRGLLTMKKSPAALERRPSKSQQQIISSSGVQACARQRSTCTCLWTPLTTLAYAKEDLQQLLRASTPRKCSSLLGTLCCL